jgi:hypothetical protein
MKKCAFSWDGAGLLIVLPFLNMSMTAATYTFLPLHFLDTPGFSLSALGLIFMFGNASRLLTATVITRYGDWCILLFLVPLAVIHAWLLMSDASDMPATFATFVMLYASNSILSLQGLVHQTFSNGGGGEDTGKVAAGEEPELKRALRVFTVSETTGYATATLLGGLLYDYGGFELCIYTQFGFVVAQIVVFACLPAVHTSMAKSCRPGRHRGAEVQTNGDRDDNDDDNDNDNVILVDGVRFTPDEIYDSIRPFVWMTLAFHFWNLLTYATEWALFAVFFRQQYNWSSSWTGAGQMSGDLLAASVLLVSVAACGSKSNSSKDETAKTIKDAPEKYAPETPNNPQAQGARIGGCCHSFVSAPYNVFLLAITIGGLNLLMAAPNFVCSVVAQVLMGTVYVFGIQAVNEIISVLTRGSHSLYRRIMYIARILWDVAVSVTGLVALIVYEDVGPSVPFVAVGVGMLALSVVYLVFVVDRYGCRGRISVDDLEKARLLRRRQATELAKDKEDEKHKVAIELVIV